MQCFIFDPIAGGFSRYELARSDILPHTEKAPLRLCEFLGSTQCAACWTDRRFLAAYCALQQDFPLSFSAFGGFRRAKAGRPLYLSPRTAGLTLHTGQSLAPKEQKMLRHAAIKSGLFSRVAPEYEAPTWVQLEGFPASESGTPYRFPKLYPGDAGVHVFALQDALALHGFPPDNGLTGRFLPDTEHALALFLKSLGRTYPGKVTADVWRLV